MTSRFTAYEPIKFICERAKSLEDIEWMLLAHAERIRRYRAQGVVLLGPVENGYLHLGVDDPAIAQALDFTGDDDDEGDSDAPLRQRPRHMEGAHENP